MLSKRHESTEVDRYKCPRALNGPQAMTLVKKLKYKKETYTQMYTPF